MRRLISPWISAPALVGLITITAVNTAGCGDGGTTAGTESTTTTTTGGGGTGGTGGSGTTGGGGAGGATTTTTGGGGVGGTTTTTIPDYVCTKTAPGDTRGSALALSPDDKVLVAVNRDVGTVGVFHITYPANTPTLAKVAELVVGAPDSEPWQVAMDGCGSRAYVVLRKEQRIVELIDLETATPAVGDSLPVGSEPTGIAITPNNKQVYVTNWVNGTVTAIQTQDMSIVSTIDLNKAIAATGLLGTVDARPALAHPRAIAITNNGDANDNDEKILVTEWFALRTAADALAGVTIDTNWKGLVYQFGVGSATVTTVDLPPVLDTGFKDSKGETTGCFPNQVGSITVKGDFAYVTSTCASPKGPIGVFQKAACAANAACTLPNTCNTAIGSCTGSCLADADCGFGSPAGTCDIAGGGACKVIPTNVKTTTHPAVTTFKISDGTGATTLLDQKFDALVNAFPKRVPLLPSDLDFKDTFAYVTGLGTDAAFRMATTDGVIGVVGSGSNNFINLRADANDKVIRMPIGVAIARTAGAFAFVNSDGSREVQTLDLGTQTLLNGALSSALPAAGSAEEKVLKGKRFFNTGLGRWSLRGEGWGACAACHIDGLTDNVTWYFARGPRQSVSLDGSFAKDGTDQRIFNWTAIFDEVADFEGNTRGISGGVGAIVSVNNSPATNADRINTATETPPQQGLQGSSRDTANPAGTGAHPHSVLSDWAEIEDYIKTIRSPRRATNLLPADVAAGKVLFDSAQGNCVGCHSGAKWTISTVFWPVGDAANAATASVSTESLGVKDWFTGQALNGFPPALFPVTTPDATNARMRFGAPPGAEQMQCILRPVGTIKAGADTTSVSPADVGVLELRQDMVTKGQGAGDTGRGFNPPSLLGMQVGAPYFHAGNARTLDEALDDLFKGHYQSAVAQVFAPNAAQKKQLVAYLLSIDEDEPAFPIPAKGAKGGDLCFYP